MSCFLSLVQVSFNFESKSSCFMCVEPTHKRGFSSNPGVASPDCIPRLVQSVRELESHRGGLVHVVDLSSFCLSVSLSVCFGNNSS
jgi:hypothetical protein